MKHLFGMGWNEMASTGSTPSLVVNAWWLHLIRNRVVGKAEPRLAFSPAVSLRVASSLARPWLWPRAAMLPRPSAVWTGRRQGLIPTATDPLTAMAPCFEQLFFWTGNEKGLNFAGSKKDLPWKIMGNHGNGMLQNRCISYVYIAYSGIVYFMKRAYVYRS